MLLPSANSPIRSSYAMEDMEVVLRRLLSSSLVSGVEKHLMARELCVALDPETTEERVWRRLGGVSTGDSLVGSSTRTESRLTKTEMPKAPRAEDDEYKEGVAVLPEESSSTGPEAFMSKPAADIQTCEGAVFGIGLHGEGRGGMSVSVREMTCKLPSDIAVGLRSRWTITGGEVVGVVVG